jgi:hypothetical protein
MTMRNTVWTLAVCALLTAASAQITYQEQGDAGDLPETAQATEPTPTPRWARFEARWKPTASICM